MDKDLRVSLLAASAAAALSALVGIIAGVGFFTIFLRAIVGGLAIGAVVYGGITLLKRSLPGLLDSGEAGSQESVLESLSVPEMGANVDIVLPGDSPAPDSGPTSAERFGAKPSQSAEPPDAELVEEPAYIDEPSLLEPEGASLEAETAIPSGASRDGGKRPSLGFDELDVLPDLDGFSDSFSASEFASGGSAAERPERPESRSPASLPSGGGASVPRTAQGGIDSAALAQAVRTILKRDQKG